MILREELTPLEARKERLREIFRVDSAGRVSHEEFKHGLQQYDRHIVDWEIEELVRVCDPKKRGYIDISKFLDQFGTEFLKVKSLRSSPGKKNILGWEATLSDKYSKLAVMQNLREREEVVF